MQPNAVNVNIALVPLHTKREQRPAFLPIAYRRQVERYLIQDSVACPISVKTSNPVLAPYLALLLIALELRVNRSNVSRSLRYQADVIRTLRYLKLNLDNVLKAFFDLWLLESRIKSCESRMRKDAPFLGIEFADI